MASKTITTDVFQHGTTVDAYARSNFPSHQAPSGAPVGSASDSAVVSGNTVTFTGLAPNTSYVAHAEVGSVDRYIAFDTTVADADAFDALDRDNGQAGIVAPSGYGWSAGTSAMTASRAYYMRFVPSRDMTVTSVAFVVTTAAGTDDAVDVGIYDGTGTRLVSSGATTGKLNVTGRQVVTIAETVLNTGLVYYAAIAPGAFGGTAPQAVSVASGGVGNGVHGLFGATMPTAAVMIQSAAHPLPASATGSVTTSSAPGVVLAVNE